MFIDVFERICQEKGISPSRVLLDLDMGKSSVTRWRSGGEPSNSTKRKIADYFGVSVDSLSEKEPVTISDDGLNQKEAEFLKVWRKVPEERKEMLWEMIVADLKSKGLM